MVTYGHRILISNHCNSCERKTIRKRFGNYIQMVHVHRSYQNMSLKKWDLIKTRMHSSRMRIARLLSVSPSIHCWGWAVCPDIPLVDRIIDK